MQYPVYRIAELCEIKSGKRLPKNCDFSPYVTNFPYIRGRDIKNGKINTEDLLFIEEDVHLKIKKYIIETNDIALTIVGSVGDVGYATEAVNGFNLTENAVRLTNFKKNVYGKYLFYVLNQKQYYDYMQLIAGAAAQPKLGIYKIERIKVELPEISTQRRISSILTAYDDLIENNNRRIKILEQMAENLYKEWFIRFRFPGHEQTEFENGIPKGWQICRMSEFCYVTDGTHDTPTPVDVGVPLITGKCICSGTIDFSLAYNISHTAHEKIKKRSGLTSGDILFSNIGTVGNCCIVDYDREFSVKNVIIFKPETRNQTEYLYYWMTNAAMQEIFSAQTNGASQQFVGLTFMRNFKILVPTEEILTAFADKISIFTEHKSNLRKCNLNLTKQRDLLLPRLMSGKLEV